jgi:hypothetical protein
MNLEITVLGESQTHMFPNIQNRQIHGDRKQVGCCGWGEGIGVFNENREDVGW